MLHNSRSSSVSKNESKEIQETTSATAKKKDECVDKDSEILRLIEERRNVPKEERQRLKSHLGVRVPHHPDEAGSIVFHSSSSASEFKNDNKEA